MAMKKITKIIKKKKSTKKMMIKRKRKKFERQKYLMRMKKKKDLDKPINSYTSEIKAFTKAYIISLKLKRKSN